MRVVSADGREVIATSEELTSANALPEATIRDAQHLNLSFNSLTSLQGLHAATHLRNLNVSHNEIASLRGVETFQQLRLLRCSGNSISDLSWLAGLPSLRELWVNDNQIETAQIAHLATLRALETLVLHPNPCTTAVNYISYVVKAVPWLTRVDLVLVDDMLRLQSQRLDERTFLSSAATDVSEISLMTTRSDDALPDDLDHADAKIEEEQAQASKSTADLVLVEKTATVTTQAKVPTKKTKKMTAEDIMRSFPVQDIIPDTGEGVERHGDSSSPQLTPSAQLMGSGDPQVNDNGRESNQYGHDVNQPKGGRSDTASSQHSPETHNQIGTMSLSAIASAVQCLPLFGDDSTLQTNKRLTAGLASKSKKPKKKGTPSKSLITSSPDPALASFNQQEWITMYPSSTVTAVQVRPDGSALAKWPGGIVAVSVDRERDGFRCYAAHKDGTIALSFDADGVGFINYYPSGRMMISTSSSGDGLYFSSEGSIVRQWDAQLNMKNDKWESIDTLSDTESDGALVAKLSDGLGVRLQLQPAGKQNDGSQRSRAISLTVFFNSGSGIRHAFCNWINKGESTADACAAIFGKEVPKLRKKPSDSRTHSHFDTLHDIRAAVSKLS